MTITHNTTTHRFETTIDGHTAYLSYRSLNDDLLDYDHTIFPDALGGRGIGKQLAQTALDYAQQNDKRIRPSCSFVAHFINKNPQYQNLVDNA